MLIFDRVRLQDLDRRNWQLWILAITMILILAGALAVHMYTLASMPGDSTNQRATLQWMIAFCALAILFVSYLVNRQLVIGQLRRELEDEKRLNLERRGQGNKELLRRLLGLDQFCERLGMVFERAARRDLPLSGLTISLEVSPDVTEGEEIYTAFGEAVRAMMYRLRGEDSIYQFTSGVFGILLPETGAESAHRVAVRVADGLNEAMGPRHRYSFDIRITSFPEHAKTAREMDRLMREPRAQ